MALENEAVQYLEKLESNPHDITAVIQLERLYSSDWDGLIELLTDHATNSSNTELSSRLLLEAGRIMYFKIGDSETSGDLFKLAGELAGETSLVHEVKIFQKVRDNALDDAFAYFTEVIDAWEVSDDSVEATKKMQDEQSVLYFRVASILENVMGNDEEADTAYQWSSQLSPSNVAAFWARQSLAEKSERWADYAELLIEEYKVQTELQTDVPRQLEILLTLGDVYQVRLDQPQDAAQCYANVYEFDPKSERARSGLLGLGYELPTTEAERVDSAFIMEGGRIGGSQFADDSLVEAEPHLDLEVGSFSSEAVSGEELYVASEIVEDVESSVVELIAESEGEESEFLEAEAVENSTADAIAASDDIVAAPELEPSLMGVSDFHDSEPLDVMKESSIAEEEIETPVVEVEIEPSAAEVESDPLVVKEIEEGDWIQRVEGLIETGELKDLIRGARIADRNRGLHEFSAPLWKAATDYKVAAAYYEATHFLVNDTTFWQEAFENTKGDLKAKIAFISLQDAGKTEEIEGGFSTLLLKDAAQGRENWRKFQRTVEQRFADLEENEKNRAVYTRMADIATAIGAEDKEMDAMRRLDRVMKNDPTVNSRLKRIYRASSKWPGVVEIVKKELVAAEDRDDKIDILREQIWIYREHMKNNNHVVSAYKEILQLDEQNTEAIDALAELYETMNKSSDLVSILKKKAEFANRTEEKIEIHSRIATIFVEKFRNQAEALKSYEHVIELDPLNVQATHALFEMYEKRREWDKLIALKRKRLIDLSDEEMIQGTKEIAQLASNNRKSSLATELWQEVRNYDPKDRDALDALEKEYAKTKDYVALADILKNKAEIEEDATLKIKILQKLGLLYSDRIQDPSSAIDAWKTAFELNPEDLKSKKSLEKLYIDGQKWDALETFYEQAATPKDLVRLFSSLSGKMKDPAVKIELLTRSARVVKDKLGDPARAEKDLEKVLSLDPQNAFAAIELEPIYEANKAYEKLRGVYETILNAREEIEDRRFYLEKLGELSFENLNDPHTSYRWYAQALRESPHQEELYGKTENAARASDVFEVLVETYRDVLAKVSDNEALTQNVSLRLGQILSVELNQTDEALEIFESVLANAPDQPVALSAMADIFERTQRWDDLMKIYEHRIQLAEDPQDRVEILRGMAVIAEEQAGDVPQAISRHLEALAIDENYLPSLNQLHRLYQETGAYEKLVSIIEREILLIETHALTREKRELFVDYKGLLPGDAPEEVFENEADGFDFTDEELEQAIGLYYELGVVSKDALQDPEKAITSLSKVLQWLPNHSEARLAIESYLEDPDYSQRVSKVLDDVYALKGDWERYIQTLEIQKDASRDISEKMSLERNIAKIFIEEIGDPERAFFSYGNLLKLDPENAEARQEVYKIANALHDWEPLVELYEAVFPEVEDKEIKLKYLYELAGIYGDEIEDADRAQEALERILEIDENEKRALNELEQLFIQTAQWRPLLDILQRKLETEDVSEVIEELRLSSALLWEEKLENREEAIVILEEIRKANSKNLSVIESLNRLYTTEERWSDLAISLEQQLDVVPDVVRIDIKNRLAEVRAEKLNEADLAVDIYEEVLVEDPKNVDALAALEHMMFDEKSPQGRIASILEPLFKEQDNWQKLVEALEVKAGASDDPEESVVLLHRIADLQEYRAHNSDAAFRIFARALHFSPQDKDTIDNLYRIAGAQSEYLALVQTFESEVRNQDSPEVKRDLLRRAATIYRDILNNIENASHRLNEVMELFPDDIESVVELESIHRQTQDWSALVQVLGVKAELVEALDEKTTLLHQAGTMYEEFLEDIPSAIDAYNRVLELKPDDLAAIDRVANLYAETDQWDKLLGVYELKVSLAQSVEEKKDLYFAIGGIHSEALKQPHDAIDTYRRILELDENDTSALGQLDELYKETEQWNELLLILKRCLDLTTAPQEALALKFRIGALLEHKLYEVPEAINRYQEILEFDAFHEDAQNALAAIIERGDDVLAAANVLEPVYLQSARWDELIHVYELQIHATDEVERKVRLFTEIGSTYESRLADKGAAFQAYAHAIQVVPTDIETLNTLERLAGELGAWDILIEILDGELEEATEPDTIQLLNRRIARIQEEELSDVSAAIGRFNRVLEIDPDDSGAIVALDRLYQREGDWNSLTKILDSRVMNAAPEERLALQLRLGRVYQSALEQPTDALSIYRDILADEPENYETISALEEMFMSGQAVTEVAGILEPFYASRNQHDKLIEIYIQRLDQIDDPSEKYDVWILIANTFVNELNDKPDGLGAYAKALEQKPADEFCLETMMQLAEDTNLWQDAAEYLTIAIDGAYAGEEASMRLYNALGLIYEKHLGKVEQAEHAYLSAMTFDESNDRALSALDHIYDQQGRYEDLATIITKRIEQSYEEDTLVELNFRLAGIYQNQLAQLDDAVNAYSSVLELEPDYSPALGMLEEIHQQRSDWPALYDVLERQSSLSDDTDIRATKFSFMAQIAEQALEQKDDAIDLYSRVLQLRPEDLEALQQLHRLYIEEERWSDLVDILDQEVELTPNPQEKLPLYESLGIVWSERLGNENQAMEAWQKVLEIDPFHLQALEALRTIYEREGDYVELSEVLSRMLQLDNLESDRLQELWAKQGEIQGDMLMQPDNAIESWRQVLAFDPQNIIALDNLERQYLSGERWEEAAQILEMRIDTMEDPTERLELLERIANIWESRVENPDRAAYFYEQMVEIDPINEVAGASLETIYQQQASVEAYQKLASLYLDRSDQNAADPIMFLESRRASADVFEKQLQEPQGAFLVLLTAFSEKTVDDLELIGELERLAPIVSQWDDLIAHFEKVISLVSGADAFDLHQLVGRWLSEKLGQNDEAIYHYQRALAIEPEHLETMEKLEHLYRELNDWTELSHVLHARVELSTDPDEQVSLWRRLGELYELQLQDTVQAVEAYKRIIEIDSGDILAIESLERIYEDSERWPELIEVLNKKAETTYDVDDQVKVGFRVAKIWEDKVGDIEHAISAYSDILSVDQTHLQSLIELERIYTAHQQWEGLSDVYEKQLNLSSDPVEQAAIYHRQAALFEGPFEDMEGAIDSFNNILMIDPEHSETLANLKRLYQENERWFDLVEIVQKQGEISERETPMMSATIWNELAEIQRRQISDPNSAIESYRRSVNIDPNQLSAWTELASLYQEIAEWNSAVECNQKMTELGSGEVRVNAFYQIGFLYESNLQNDIDAEQNYERALDLQANHQPALLALRDLYRRRGDWQSTIRVVKQAEETSRDLGEKASFLCEIGKVYDQELNDPVSALHYYQSALENDPDSIEAAEPLIDLYVSERRWERAAPLLERFLRDVDSRDKETQHRRYLQHATVCRELSKDEEARDSLRAAYELNPNDTDTLLGLGEVLYKGGEWEQGFQIFQTLLFNHTDSLENTKIVDIYFKSAEVKRKVGEDRRAIQLYQKALEYDPNYSPAVEKLIEAYEAEENWEQVIAYSHTKLEGEEDTTIRFTQLVHIGDIWMQKLNRPANATTVYLQALEVETKSVTVLRKLLDIYTKSRQWPDAIEMLKRLAELEQNPNKRSKYLYTVAVITRDEIRDANQAVEAFEATLDTDPKMLKSFEAIDRILTETKQWKELERAYRRMIRRVTENDDGTLEDIKVLLWTNLGEIYRSRLNHVKSAIGAYEAAVSRDPKNEKLHLILAELYEKKSDNKGGAIEHHKAMIEHNPFRIDSYRALWKAYMMLKEYDKAWCMTGALSFLGKATQQEDKFYRQYLGQNVKRTKGGFNQDVLKLLYHGPQDIVLMSMILGILGQGLRHKYSRPLKDLGVHKKKDRLDPNEKLIFTQVYSYVAQTTGMLPAPALFLKQDKPLGIMSANSEPPAFIIGGDMMAQKTDRELTFLTAKKLAWARPEHYLGSIGYPTEFVKVIFMSAMAVTDPSLGIQNSLGEGAAWITEIQKLQPQFKIQLVKRMQSYLSLGHNPNLSKWITHVDHTTNRFGLLLCGDLAQAAASIKSDNAPVGKATVKDKIRELVLFSISDEYFELRKMLGLAIGSQ